MKFITEGTGAEGIKNEWYLFVWKVFKEHLALWVGLVCDTRCKNSQYNNA